MSGNHAVYELTVGLEVHIQLLTKSKLFSGEPAGYSKKPNTNVGVITLAHPGILPMLNEKAVELAIRLGLACNSTISRRCIFDRKNYFYPDLPKGFQTTQDSSPICVGGELTIKDGKGEFTAVLNRIHLEEDAGKSIHGDKESISYIDLNRAGTPLVELVTEPCFQSAEQVMTFLYEIRKMVQYLEVSDGNMEEGSLRCDANISIRPKGSKQLGRKVEVKNMNSVKNVGRAINYEFKRQSELLRDQSGEIVQETRLFDVNTGRTYGMRLKEELNDYRYFPEPDLAPFTISEEKIDAIKESMPMTPAQKKQKLMITHGLNEYDADILTETKPMVEYFLSAAEHTNGYKRLTNWIIGPVRSVLKDRSITIREYELTPSKLGELVECVEKGQLHASIAKERVLPILLGDPSKNLEDLLHEVSGDATSNNDLKEAVLRAIRKYPDKAKALKNGKKNLIGLFMGEVMKETKRGGDPAEVKSLIMKSIQEELG